MAPGACAFAPLFPSSPPRSSGTRFQPPGLREEEGAGQARSGHLGVTRRLQLPLPRPQGLGRGPPPPRSWRTTQRPPRRLDATSCPRRTHHFPTLWSPAASACSPIPAKGAAAKRWVWAPHPSSSGWEGNGVSVLALHQRAPESAWPWPLALRNRRESLSLGPRVGARLCAPECARGTG